MTDAEEPVCAPPPFPAQAHAAAPSTPAIEALVAASVPHRVVRTEIAQSAEESATL